MVSTYILIDTNLIGHPSKKPWVKRNRTPTWVKSLYTREAITVSPILIDLERAYICNKLDVVMDLVNAENPKLGISFIESEMDFEQVKQHFSKFIFIKTEDDIELTLRFADCLVLAELSKKLSAEQWSAIVSPLKSWKVHRRDGSLTSLPIKISEKKIPSPLILSDMQISNLKNSMGGYQLLVNLNNSWPNIIRNLSRDKSFEYAEKTREKWLAAGHVENIDLVWFLKYVFDSNGRLLQHPRLNKILSQKDPAIIRIELKIIMGEQWAKENQ